MLFIWGFKARSRTEAMGEFFCPREGGDRGYRLMRARRWFTFFFVPLVPLNDLGGYVECSSCGSTYYPEVIGSPTSSDLEDVLTTAVRHMAVSIVLADEVVDDDEVEAASIIVSGFASHPYSDADFKSDLLALRDSDLEDVIEELGAILNEHGKERLVRACLLLASVDGNLDPAELQVIERIAGTLLMSAAHVRGIVADFADALANEPATAVQSATPDAVPPVETGDSAEDLEFLEKIRSLKEKGMHATAEILISERHKYR